jgi:hypothetical protein
MKMRWEQHKQSVSEDSEIFDWRILYSTQGSANIPKMKSYIG